MMTMVDDHYGDLEESRWSVDFTEAQPLLQVCDQRMREKRAKQKIMKNLGAMVLAMGIFSLGLNPIDDLQSSLIFAGGLGVKYGAMILANLLTNTFLIWKLGSKWALVGGALFYCLYIVANFYPIWASMVPLTAIAGMGGALMWTTMSSYLARLAIHYAKLTSDDEDRSQALFFSMKNAAGYSCAVLGCIASFFIMGSTSFLFIDFPSDRYALCGPNYCNEELEDFLDELLEDGPKPTLSPAQSLDMVTLYGLCGFCLAVTLFAVVILSALVDSLPSLGIAELRDAEGSSCCGQFLATVRLWKNPKLLLLIPMSVVYGFHEAFWRVEFNKAYVTCALGIYYIGFLMIFFNLAALFSSFACGWLGSRTRRAVAFVLLAAIEIAALVYMLYWHPTGEDLALILIVTGVSGITYGGVSTLLLIFFAVAFPNCPEAAFSNLYFWNFLGSTLMYAASFNLCLKVKLLVVLALVILGISGYAMTEVLLISEEKQQMTRTAEKHRAMMSKRMLVPAGF